MSPRRTWAAALAAWVALVVVSLATHSYLPVDETRYVGVAWEMWRRDDLVLPWLGDAPYHHKPPLLFWLIHAGWALTGVDDTTPRIAASLPALGATWLARRLAMRLWPGDARTAALVPVLLLGCLWWALFASATMFDTIVACATVLGMLGLLVAADGRLVRGFAIVGLALGLGLLGKGPTILLQLLPAALLAPWWAAAAPRRGWGRWYAATGAAVLLGAAIVLAWAIPAAVDGGPQYARMIFWGQTADRMVESFAHRAPAWWYLAVFPAMVFPWVLWPPTWHAWRRAPAHLDAGLRFCIAWFVPVFAAFSLVSGKQAHYLLPLLPAFALATARLLSATIGDAPQTRAQRLPPAAAGVALAGLVALAAGHAQRFGGAAWIATVPAYAGLGVAAWSTLCLLPRRPRLEGAALLVAGIGVVTVMNADLLIRYAGTAYDVRPVSRHLAALERRGVPLGHVGKYHGQFQFPGRLARTPEVLSADAVDAWFERHPDGRVVAYFRAMPPQARPEFSQRFAGRELGVFDRDGWRTVGDAAAARESGRGGSAQPPDQSTTPVQAVTSTTSPNAIRYHANGTKSCRDT